MALRKTKRPEKSILASARELIEAEARAVDGLAARLDETFAEAVGAIASCEGRVVVTGMGKAGFLAQRLSALFASLGIASLYLHPAEAAHGDLGRLTDGDLLIALSQSGATEELLRLLPAVRGLGIAVVALTGRADSPLGRAASHALSTGAIDEDGTWGRVPTASSAALHALGDALALGVARARGISQEKVARLHPGGAMGRATAQVRQVMREGEAVPRVAAEATLARAVAVMTETIGRPGCALAVDRAGRLAGIFTDGDLRRLIERGELDLKARLRAVMSADPVTVSPEARVLEAAQLLRDRRIDQVAVVDRAGRPVGLLDVQDLLAAHFID